MRTSECRPASRLRLAICLSVLISGLVAASPVFAQFRTARPNVRIGHAHCCGRQDVILIRGGAGYWPGVHDLARHLQSLGYVPTVIQHWEYPRVAEEITQAVREGRMTGGVVIIGYSTGADTACWLADRLDEKGIRVETMVLIESTFGIAVPPNVDYCVNYYESRPFDMIPAFRGVPVVAKSPQTQLANINVGRDASLKSLAVHNHFTLANCFRLHQIVGEVALSRQPPDLTRPAVESIADLPQQGAPAQR